MTPISTTLTAIEHQDWLEPVEKGLKQALDNAFQKDSAAGKPVENALHGVWLGHPVHPVITDIPVGAWTVVCALDLIEEVTGSRSYRAGSDAALSIGIAGAAAAVVTGLTDWKEISTEARRTGLVHGLLNTAALGLYIASAVQRATGNRSSARVCSYVGYGITTFSAWLGGHLVYANQIGVARTSAVTPPTDFVPVAPLAELEEGRPHKAQHQGYNFVLVKKADRIYALAEECTHLGAPLSQGQVEGDCIRCPWHGSLFSLETGAVKESPAVHPQMKFETRIHNGQIEVRVQPDSLANAGIQNA